MQDFPHFIRSRTRFVTYSQLSSYLKSAPGSELNASDRNRTVNFHHLRKLPLQDLTPASTIVTHAVCTLTERHSEKILPAIPDGVHKRSHKRSPEAKHA